MTNLRNSWLSTGLGTSYGLHQPQVSYLKSHSKHNLPWNLKAE